MKRLPFLALVLLSACAPDPCSTGLDDGSFEAGAATLAIDLIEQDGAMATKRRPMECADVLVFDKSTYSDTLAHGRFDASTGKIRVNGLPAEREVDVIVDLPGFFPAKFVDVRLHAGTNTLPEKVLMFRSDTPVVLPAQLGVTMRSGLHIRQVRSMWGAFGQVRILSGPGNNFELRIPFRGTRGTRRDVESLLGQLVRSPLVKGARPLVTYEAISRLR